MVLFFSRNVRKEVGKDAGRIQATQPAADPLLDLVDKLENLSA
jgi:hypothetical protein